MIFLKPNGLSKARSCDISFNKEIVLQKREKLRDDKAEGADELVIFQLDQTGICLPVNYFIPERCG